MSSEKPGETGASETRTKQSGTTSPSGTISEGSGSKSRSADSMTSTTVRRGVEFAKAFDKSFEGKSVKELLDAPVSALQGLSEGDATRLKESFNIKTIRDLATNKFFRRALGIYFMAGEA